MRHDATLTLSRGLLTTGGVIESCARARALADCCKYEEAREVLVERWPDFGGRPRLDGLEPTASAEMLLRVGSLTGWIGDTRRVAAAQDVARSLLDEGARMFRALADLPRAAECLFEAAWCHWREGDYDAAAAILREALALAGDEDVALRASILVRAAINERFAGRLHGARELLDRAAPLVGRFPEEHTLQGRFHGERAAVLRNLGSSEGRADFVDAALIDYAAASYHYEQAGNLRFCAFVENNLGFLFFTLRQFVEAHTHLDRARKIFHRLGEAGSVAQVDETRARVLLEEGKPREAEHVVKPALCIHEACGEDAFLAQALTTHATALARLGLREEGRAEFRRAVEVAGRAGAAEAAGRAAHSLAAELGEFLRTAPSNVVSIHSKRVTCTQTFLIRVIDDSLLLAGIRRSDIVRLTRAQEFADGDLGAVSTPDGTFLVFIRCQASGVLLLEGAHPRCPARVYRREEITLLGIADSQERISP